ncbi:MAG TPA: glycosyltransferase family 2 protein [Falsiroseomonas sp.]|jgi:cellulose synthase/poly-beta-1,6-N-acetylglucosamine synthase-like glycosyltransferase|nr:glycosyltransferase family 2 protein [Falsiroseomonas sp.]
MDVASPLDFTWAWIALFLATFPATMGLVNLILLGTARGAPAPGTVVSILVPARNEETHIAFCLEAALASRGVAVEVVVMDDGSTDRTAESVRAIATRDPRVRLETCPPLPPGWTGKVHACARLAEAATGTHLLFIDADVRLEPGAAAAMSGHAQRAGAAMVTGVPRQIIGSLGEALTVPMINFLVYCYLPGGGRAFTRRVELAAACGQLMMVERRAYEDAGGHAGISGVLHDALQLARKMRAAGHRTEVVEGAPLATCRMYTGFAQSWRGFIKNAREGMATPVGLPIWTAMLAGAFLWPIALLPSGWAFLALGLGFALRAAVTFRTREPWWTIPLHPATVAVALAIQWTALVRGLLGKREGWKGRAYQGGAA